MIYDEFATKLQREYELFLFALSGRYLNLIAPGAAVSPMMVRQMETEGAKMRDTFLHSATQRADDFARTYTVAGAQQRSEQFLSDLKRITTENIATITQRMKTGSANTLSGIKHAHGAIGLLLQQKLSNPDFRVKTPKGRSFDAVGYVFAEARNFAYLTWIDATLEKIAVTSDLAEVRYPNPEHTANGTVFSISGKTPGYKTFAEVKLLFHYNSTAFPHDHVPS